MVPGAGGLREAAWCQLHGAAAWWQPCAKAALVAAAWCQLKLLGGMLVRSKLLGAAGAALVAGLGESSCWVAAGAAWSFGGSLERHCQYSSEARQLWSLHVHIGSPRSCIALWYVAWLACAHISLSMSCSCVIVDEHTCVGSSMPWGMLCMTLLFRIKPCLKAVCRKHA
eukprot:11201993-Lingulodinium_polyedra.AAC.1